MIKRDTEWKLGHVNLKFPAPPPDQRGRVGCRLLRNTFDPAVGEEVFVLFEETPAHYSDYKDVHPFNLFAHRGLIPTPHGAVAYIVWRVAADSPCQFLGEQFLNPYREGTQEVVRDAAGQTHLKLVVMNNQTGEVGAFVDFENVFGLDELEAAIRVAAASGEEGDFGKACRYVEQHYSVQELLG